LRDSGPVEATKLQEVIMMVSAQRPQLRSRNRLNRCPSPKKIAEGSQTHFNSLRITVTPVVEKKAPTPIGETSMGW
jgi:hypothetical protein